MKCKEIMDCLEEVSPKSFAEDWDNVGLICGREEKEVKKIYLAVDATKEMIDAAIEAGADMILTHHPLIFQAVKKIQGNHFIGERILTLAEHQICYYAMHTNFDVMGMADAVADELDLQGRQVLSVTYEDDISMEGIGRIGTLPTSMTLQECAQYVKKTCCVEHVKVFGDPEEVIIMAAVCPGSGKGYIDEAIRAGADVYITGDVDHHAGIDAIAQGLSIIDAGHYGLEKVFVPYMAEYLHRKLPEIELILAPEKYPFWII